ncbi:MAG: M1 family metallopeptidase [Bacteroidetes bacterium]|nr:M1 family metallopeptidase [Bacteroidota bacterium]
MMQLKTPAFAFLLLWVAACSTSKKALKNAAEQNLPAIEITASRENPYRASATKDFDLIHTKLEVTPDYQKQYLYGKATITLKPHFYPQKELVLDAKQFDIKEVSVVSGENSREGLAFTYDSLELKITLNKEYTRNDRLKIFIDYTAKPNERKSSGSAAISDDKGLYFINPLGTDTTKPIQIWTQGETESNSCWFPTIDKPNQKQTDEIYITHPKKYLSLSNGTLISSNPVNDSTVTDYWKMDLPHAPYLIMMAIGDFAVIQDRWRDVPVNYYVEKSYAPYAKQIFGNTPEMMEFFSQKLQFDYPWQKYAQMVVRDYVSGAMENTTATIHGEFMQRNPRELLDETYEDVISHELFHQWFGDLVTTESWSNIPLNESFATYGEYLWNEYKYGRDFADYKAYENYELYISEARAKNVDMIRYYYDNREEMFDRHSYEKGGLILHSLRKTVGDDAFFKSLELYLKTNQFKPVELAQLRLAFEEVTGKDMNWFFNQWFMNSGHPVLDIKYRYENDSVYVAIEQKQSNGKGLVYQLPAKIGVWYGNQMTAYDVVIKKKAEEFSFKAKGKPDLIDFASDRALLCEKKENKNLEEYVFQYKHAPLFDQRREALNALAESQKQNDTAKQVMILALNDHFFYLREFAIRKLTLSKEDAAWSTIESMAKNDKSSRVRAAAIEKLSKSSRSKEYATVFASAATDSSYDVASAALKALSAVDSIKALATARTLENEKNNSLAAAVADIFSKNGDSTYQTFFESKLRQSSGIGKYTSLYYYANFLIRMNKEMVLSGIETITAEGNNSENVLVKGGAKGALKRIVKSFEERKKNTKDDSPELISNYEAIIRAANSGLEKLTKTSEPEKN